METAETWDGMVTRLSADGLRRETWAFWIRGRYYSHEARYLLRDYLLEIRTSTRARWHWYMIYGVVGDYNTQQHPRCQVIRLAEVPFPPDVADEARSRFAAGIVVQKERTL